MSTKNPKQLTRTHNRILGSAPCVFCEISLTIQFELSNAPVFLAKQSSYHCVTLWSNVPISAWNLTNRWRPQYESTKANTRKCHQGLFNSKFSLHRRYCGKFGSGQQYNAETYEKSLDMFFLSPLLSILCVRYIEKRRRGCLSNVQSSKALKK